MGRRFLLLVIRAAALAGLAAGAGRAQSNAGSNAPVFTPDTVAGSQSISALNGTAQAALAGQPGASVTLSGTWSATITPELSFDGGSTWVTTFFVTPAGQVSATVAANGSYGIVLTTGASHARVRASAFTSGTATAMLRASAASAFAGLANGPAGGALPPVATLTAASDGTNLRPLSADSSGRLALAGSSGVNIIAAATTAVKGTAGVLRRVVVGTGVASATVKLFNVASASCSGTPTTGAAGVITLPATLGNPFTVEFNQTFSAGICVVTSAAVNVTVVFD